MKTVICIVALFAGLAMKAEAADSPKDLSFYNFSNAEVTDAVKIISKKTGRSFVVDPSIRGKITVQLQGAISDKLGYNAFLKALATNGIAVWQDGDVERVVLAANAIRSKLPVVTDPNELQEERMVTWVFKTKNISASEVNKNLGRILLSRYGELSIVDERTIVMTDWLSTLQHNKQILELIDVAHSK